MKQIGIAMHNYHDLNNQFPPAAVCDKKGKPQLSWRVLILPYIEQEELYKQFKLDEPWDSENNKKLIAKMPPVYAMPGKTKPGDTTTYYRVFVGNGAGFDWVMGGKITNITDGTSNTFMCVTGAEAVTWTKPDELEFDPEKDMTKLIGMVVNGKAQVAMFDGSVRTLSKLPDRKTLNALITAAGGEVVNFDF
jgi:prepilin-type processing-associated H-X9-DG protein